jgi:hypothetical protein
MLLEQPKPMLTQNLYVTGPSASVGTGGGPAACEWRMEATSRQAEEIFVPGRAGFNISLPTSSFVPLDLNSAGLRDCGTVRDCGTAVLEVMPVPSNCRDTAKGGDERPKQQPSWLLCKRSEQNFPTSRRFASEVSGSVASAVDANDDESGSEGACE